MFTRLVIACGWAICAASPALAQTSPNPNRIWVGVDAVRASPREDHQSYSVQYEPISAPYAGISVAYPALSPFTSFGFEGGVNVGAARVFGFGARYQQQSHDYTPDVTTYFTDGGVLIYRWWFGDYVRLERSLDLFATYTIPMARDRVRLMVFGGPTVFHIDEGDPPSGLAPLTGKGLAAGFNVGGDLSYFFSRYVGVGGGVRFNKGTVTFEDVFTRQPADLEAGHFAVAGGVRLRFSPASAGPSVPASAPAQATQNENPNRMWIGLNVIWASPLQNEQSYSLAETVPGFSFEITTAYPEMSRKVSLGIEGGLNFGAKRAFGAGAGFQTLNQDYTAQLTIRSSSSTATFTLDEEDLSRRDWSLDLFATYTISMVDGRVRVLLFGGPTIFHVDQEMIQQRFSSGTEVSGSSIGFNANADVSYFFSRNVGVGGGVRFNRGTVTIDEPFSGQPADLDAGHFMLAGGLRLRF